MIKVLIVEDERRTARAISQLVNQHPAFATVGMEANGADALVFLAGNAVDLVIADIRMPIMDGIELLKIVRHKFPQCLTVVLSGYSEFEYAKAALQYQAFDYLLKPINKAELFHLLDRVEQLFAERSQSQFHVQIQRVLNGEKLPKSSAQVYVMLAQQNGWNQAEQSARLQQCFGSTCHLFSGSLDEERLMVIEASEQVLEQVEQFFQLASGQAQTPTYVICSQRTVDLSELTSTVNQLRSMLNQKIRMFQSELFVVNPRQPQSVQDGTPLRNMKPERAVDAVCSQDREALRQNLAQFLTPGVRRADVQNYLDSVVSDSRIAYSMSPGKLSQTKSTLAAILAHAAEVEDCVDEVTEHLLALLREPAAKRGVSEIVEEIAQHMEANYHTAISVEALAKQYSFVPRYLNKVFKDYKGVRPMEYLLTLRMNRAKAMLEAKPDALVKDVANSVGYSDPLYFSRIFKRETGMWPSEVQEAKK